MVRIMQHDLLLIANESSNRQLPTFVQFFPAAILLVGAFFVPETPRFLVGKSRDEEAMKALTWLRQRRSKPVSVEQLLQ